MPFFWVAVFFASGILLASAVHIGSYPWLIIGLICALIAILPNILRSQSYKISKIPFFVLVSIFFLGSFRFSLSQTQITPEHCAYYNDKGWVDITGVVIEPPEEYDSFISLIVRVESLTPLSSDNPLVPPETVTGRIRLQVLPGSSYNYGDRLSLRGNLQTPSEEGRFSYRKYLENKNVYSQMSFASVRVIESNTLNPLLTALYSFRMKANQIIKDIFPSPEAELLSGILLGIDSGISKELKAAYTLTGTSHIIAISGFNVAILAGLITAIFTRWFGRARGVLFTLITLTVYTLLVGAQASVMRAAIMGGFGILGSLVGRRAKGLNTLGISVFLMIIINPLLLWDVGFQLSLFATLGIVVYAEPMQARLHKFLSRIVKQETSRIISRPISEYLLVGLIAQAMSLPIIAWHFGDISWIFLLANPLILPAQPFVMTLGGLALLAGLISPGIGKILSWLAWPFAAYTNQMVYWLANLAPASTHIKPFSFAWVILYYVVFFIFTLTKDKKAYLNRLMQPATLFLALGCCSIIVWSFAFSKPDGKLNMYLFPESDNPVILLQTPGGRYVLMNGSIRASTLHQTLGNKLPFGNQQLDVLVIPLCRKSDVTALINLHEYVDIDRVVWACDPNSIQTTKNLFRSFQESKITQVILASNDWLDLGAGSKLTLKEGGKDASLFSLIWEEYEALLAFGDLQKINSTPPSSSTVFVLPGIIDPLKKNGYQNISTQLVLMTINHDSLPLNENKFIVSFNKDTSLLRTDILGTIKVSTDGNKMWVFTDSYP
jgi:competence protein ComEC